MSNGDSSINKEGVAVAIVHGLLCVVDIKTTIVESSSSWRSLGVFCLVWRLVS